MKSNHQAFTLIELLVVVLIIGILAAVAIPQYQKAILKTRLTNAVIACDALYKASKIYVLSNGFWPTKLNQLDIEMPGTLNESQWEVLGGEFSCSYISSTPSIMCNLRQNQDTLQIGIRQFFGTGFRVCFAKKEHVQYNDVCKMISSRNQPIISNDEFNYYLIS